MAESKQRAVAVRRELVADHAGLDNSLVPFVLEHMRWIPNPDAPTTFLLLRWLRGTGGNNLDHHALTGVDRVIAHPVVAMFRAGDCCPVRFYVLHPSLYVG